MYAVIEICGRQYKVEKGDVVFFEKLDVEEGKKVTFDKVILVSDNGKVQVGTVWYDSLQDYKDNKPSTTLTHNKINTSGSTTQPSLPTTMVIATTSSFITTYLL